MPRPGGLTIALAGGAGSGKTTVAGALADRLGTQVAGFGDFVRHIASQAGRESGREELQRIGQERVERDPEGFVQSFLSWAAPLPGSPLIVEGVRHEAIDRALRAWALTQDRDYALVLLDTPERHRASRRTGGDLARIRAIDGHPVERETVEALPCVAEVIVDGTRSGGEVLACIVDALGDRWPAGA